MILTCIMSSLNQKIALKQTLYSKNVAGLAYKGENVPSVDEPESEEPAAKTSILGLLKSPLILILLFATIAVTYTTSMVEHTLPLHLQQVVMVLVTLYYSHWFFLLCVTPIESGM